MTDPKRLRETHASELEGLLLESVRVDTPAPSARARTLAAVALGAAAGSAAVGAAGSASAAALPGSAVTWAFAAKWLALGAGAGVVVAGTLVGPLHQVLEGGRTIPHAVGNLPRAVTTSRTHVVAPLPVAAEATPAESRSTESVAALPEARIAGRAVMPERAAPVAPSAPERVPERALTPADPAPVTNTLPEEVAFLDAASRALRDHDPVRAHAALDSYAARFGGGNLGPEATALRIQAFLEQGDHARAERIAETFLAQNPHSPHAARVRSLLGIRLIP
jgi:hypothetical protein